MKNKIIEIKEYTDGGLHDRGSLFGFMANKDEYWEKAQTFKTVTQKFKKDFKKKFDQKFTGFYQAHLISKSEFERKKSKKEKELNKFKL